MAHLTNFSFEFFYEIFAEDVSLCVLYHGAKKSKMTKNPNQGGGPALRHLNEAAEETLKKVYIGGRRIRNARNSLGGMRK